MPSSNSLILPLALGASLATVTALVVYYVLKKDDDTGENKKVKTSRVNAIEVNVPKSIVPALIGRSGSNIKEIEKKTGALIHFKKFSDKDYDVCIIRGRYDTTQLAETFIHDFIKQQPLIIEDNMMVPNWSCGRIIGTGGETINDISHRSGARVKVEGLAGSDGGSHRVISIKGTKEQIEMAKKLIENCVAQEKCRREIEQSKRSPRVQTSSSPSPTQDRTETEDNAGDCDVTRPTRQTQYKRPESAANTSIEVYVSAVSSPSRFWVQFVGPQVTQLDELVNHMTEYYSNKENRAAHALKTVSVGQVVAAVFRHDGRWYRARIDQITKNEFDATKEVADVFFLDYGDSEYVAIHELCELRADLLRLRFQAMECFLAGVRPAGNEEDIVVVSPTGHKWEKWNPQAVERFEELTQVARWKPLVSRTCSYKKTVTSDGNKEKEIPGIKLFDVTDKGELDIGATLVAEGWAVEGAVSPRPSPPKHADQFGDLGTSRVLGMISKDRATSMPKDHKDDRQGQNVLQDNGKDSDRLITSKSCASGLENSETKLTSTTQPSNPGQTPTNHNNGASTPLTTFDNHTNKDSDNTGSQTPTEDNAPIHAKSILDDLKANMNRIDSHHGNLEALGK